jgi:xanthine/CO dehydrogenase XdhC/CoxF family maturation factor
MVALARLSSLTTRRQGRRRDRRRYPEVRHGASVSGGCVESDVAVHAREVLATGWPKLEGGPLRASSGTIHAEPVR